MKKYTLRVMGSNLKVNVEGLFTTDEATAFIAEYKSTVSKMGSKDAIELDCTKIKTSTPETLPMLESCFKMYKEDFNKIIMDVTGTAATTKLQLKRIARQAELEAQFID